MTRRERQMVSKSESIRACKALHPDWDSPQIRAKLAAEGIEVSGSLIYHVLWADKDKADKDKPSAPKTKKAAAIGNGRIINRLALVNRFAQRVGGIERARAAMDSLAKILA